MFYFQVDTYSDGLRLNGGNTTPPSLTTRRMDGVTQYPPILDIGGVRPHLASRCAHSSTPLDWTTTIVTPTDQDLFELLNRLQSSRLGTVMFDL